MESTYLECVILLVVRVTIGVHIVSCGTFFAGQAWKRQQAATDICNSLGFAFKALVRVFKSVILYLITIQMTLLKPFEPTSTWNSLPFIGKSWLSFDVKILLGCAYACALARCSFATVRWAGFKKTLIQTVKTITALNSIS